MDWMSLLQVVEREPVFTSALLLSGRVSPAQIHVQLSRWVASGRVLKLRRGLYALALPWRKVEPHPFFVANALHKGSYVSLQSALGYHGLIPEHVPVLTSVGPGRSETLSNALGQFQFRHLGPRMRFGYMPVRVAADQVALLARPEKALLDLVHLTPGADGLDLIRELRLQNLEALDLQELVRMAARAGRPKLQRAAIRIGRVLAESEGVLL